MNFVRRMDRILRPMVVALAVAGPFVAWTSAASAQDIVLGQTTSTTSPIVGALSRDYNGGIALAIARANAAGGVHGHRVRLVSLDDGYDANRTVPLVEQLVDKENAIALIGVMGSPPALRITGDRVLERRHLALFGPMSGLQSALSAPNVFPIRSSFEDEVRAMMAHCASLSRRKVLFLYYDAGAGPQLARLAPEMARDANVTLSATVAFPVLSDPAQQREAVRHALAGMGGRPDAIILLAIGRPHSEAVKVLRERFGDGMQGMPIYSLGQVDPLALSRAVGEDHAWGVMLSQVMPMPGTVELEIVREFEIDRRRFSPSTNARYAVLEGYICGRVTMEILRRSNPLTREGVLAAAEQTGQLDLGGFRVLYSQRQRRSTHPIELTMIGRNGSLVH